MVKPSNSALTCHRKSGPGAWRQQSWPSVSAVEMATLRWVYWFNNHRLFGPIGHIPPAEAEANYYAGRETLDMVA